MSSLLLPLLLLLQVWLLQHHTQAHRQPQTVPRAVRPSLQHAHTAPKQQQQQQ
jgi:hypothetical protein